MEKNSRKIQCSFRVGAFGIEQIPYNICVGEVTLNQHGEEVFKRTSIKYFKSYSQALLNLHDRIVEAKLANTTATSVKSIIQSIKDAKEEILNALKEQKIK